MRSPNRSARRSVDPTAAEDRRTRHHGDVTDDTDETGAIEGTRSAQPAAATADAGEAAVSPLPHPGRAVPWPPTAEQRGLASPYPPGGTDPAPEAGRREERFYLRLLVGMVLLIVLGGLAISVIGFVLGFSAGAD